MPFMDRFATLDTSRPSVDFITKAIASKNGDACTRSNLRGLPVGTLVVCNIS
jgi:hypothetical protein